jgi:hypothetical protein
VPANPAQNVLIYFVLPVWLAVGYLCHCAASIATTSGWKDPCRGVGLGADSGRFLCFLVLGPVHTPAPRPEGSLLGKSFGTNRNSPLCEEDTQKETKLCQAQDCSLSHWYPPCC